ncbi:NADH-ubiquinone oxidoreductase-F iron-sulfur binding region domain-containing protein [Pseudoduganella sp. UC29_106]|uniref:NADH-ubiquinone oxidoreductase-F iron-sulfur binding region domain-containing protein n=1 Tax=Pseudoduganella sp. UC29_106 TaxID=3374553 RepID=UPI0037572EBE
MNHPVIPIAVQGGGPSRERKRQAPKGRRVDPLALAQVQVLLGSSPRRRDLLIEHLHLIQDAYGCLSTTHLAALAQEMRLSQAEVFEVASFYHHFDIVREDASAASPAATTASASASLDRPSLTVRVCDGLSCELAGAASLLERLPALLGPSVRVIPAPCIGRCEQAPAALVGQRAIPHATCASLADAARDATAQAASQSPPVARPAAATCEAAATREAAAAPSGHAAGTSPANPGAAPSANATAASRADAVVGPRVDTAGPTGVASEARPAGGDNAAASVLQAAEPREEYIVGGSGAPAVTTGPAASGHDGAALEAGGTLAGAPKDVDRAGGEGAVDASDAEVAHIGLESYLANGGYALLRECVTGMRAPEGIIGELEHSGLRGLGGAGFPAGRKWRIVRAEEGPRLMAVNIDEGEPGTFKDRHYLERDPHRFIEGMLIAAWAVGIDEIYIYLRDEYHAARAMLQDELDKLRANPPFAPLPAIHLRRGAGAYICGEESAMIESIEGKRGMPRLRPPYVAQVGLFGRPTLEHNFETLYWVREIIERGADWFASQGRNGRKGLRSFSVSGRVKQPGVKLAPAGITVQELIDEYCGGMQDPAHKLYAYLPGGASGGILPASMNNIPLDFDTLQPYGCFIGSAAVIILDERDTAAAAARNMMKFFRNESCGQCTPCRAGTAKAVELIEHEQWDTDLLAELSQVMRDASICGLGQAAPNPVDCVIKYFPHEAGL